ncbi:hypothetical protein [Parenemella sanctibonifatiensis]|uniref:hypothetical protein n=1 Tax=Parenemella sanctibonifatiensis TaxID=2016505 RepID=UPI00117DC94D|nr:hypothetical protein [Parenemella sanctibonifatiensis]
MITVEDTNVSWWVDDVGDVIGVRARANHQSYVAVGGGDSGGPVLVPDFHNQDLVHAVGIISAGSNEVTCGNVDPAVEECNNVVYFVQIERLLYGGELIYG